MECEVVVVGGGIGGLTVAALLAQRGLDVCLLERESKVGGCAGSFEKFGYHFEQGYGLFTSWEPGEIHHRVFSELRVEPPETRLLELSYEVRLPDGSKITVGADAENFAKQLREVFPECAGAAIAFYKTLHRIGAALRRTLQRSPNLLTASKAARAYSLLREGRIAAEILQAANESVGQHLEKTSARFRRFIDVQLQTFDQGTSEDVSYLRAALTLGAAHGGMFAIEGGGEALANTLVESLATSGGRIRLNTTALRLDYDSTGQPVGVDLLSGETLTASKAIVSNLTIWDTYGKLIGLNRTPGLIRKQLSDLTGWGAYQLYLALDPDRARTLGADHVLALTDWQEGQAYNPEINQMMFAVAPAWDVRAPAGKLAVTVSTFTDVTDWFTFHKDESELEQRDQQMLEACWGTLHRALPELGNGVEVIETATPRSFYELTRRKLGMVGGTVPTPAEAFWLAAPAYQTVFPNVFIVSDTTCDGGIAGVTSSAFLLANKLTHN